MDTEILTPGEAGRARRYQMKRLWLGLAASAAEFAAAVVFWALVPGEWFRAAGASPFWAGAMYFAALAGVRRIVVLPIDYASGFRLAHEAGLSMETRGGWLMDQAKSLGLTVLIGGAAAGVFLWIMASRPGEWWWISAALGTALGALMALAAPVLIIPLFFKFKRISDPALGERLENLLARTGARVRGGVWEMDMSRRTRTANAALIGWGPSRRIILGDTLLEYAPEEIEAILAHEIAHHVGHHIGLQIAGRGIFLAAALFLAHRLFEGTGAFISLGAPPPSPGAPSSIGALWIFMAVGGAILAPFFRGVSRRLEFWCDRFAAAHTGGGEAMSSALMKLCRKNLADPAPPAWVVALFHSHPPLEERVRRVRGVG